ncbi:MAG: hypothetical protein ACLQVI_37040, partial [Polyangiaceae bacterium]
MARARRVTSLAFVLALPRLARFAPFVALAGVGCAATPQVQVESLALKRVVIYRNGVGYFERGGHVEGSE